MSNKTRQRYYEDLCLIGMPDVIAASMAFQTHSNNSVAGNNLEDELWAFCNWSTTKEGHDFWSAIVESLR